MKSFSEVLNAYIEMNDLSKNALIQRSEIDRSSFFQILKGKRLPTQTQLETLIRILSLPVTDQKFLTDAYLREKYGDDLYERQNFVLQLFEILKQHDTVAEIQALSVSDIKPLPESSILSGKQELSDFLKSALYQLVLSEDPQTISFFLPIRDFSNLGGYEALKTISADRRSKTLHLRQIISLSARQELYAANAYDDFCLFTDFLLSSNLPFEAYYYFDHQNMMDSLGVLFPYFILLPFGMILINKGCDAGYFTTDPGFIRACRTELDKLLPMLLPMVMHIDTLESTIPYLAQLPDHQKTWYLSWQPGLSYMATDYFIQKYIPEALQEHYRAHSRAFLHMDYLELTTPEGIQAFWSRGGLKELSFQLNGKPEDFLLLFDTYKKRIGKTLCLINSEKIPISRNWSILIVENEAVFLVPIDQYQNAILIREKNIVSAFTNLFLHLRESDWLLDNDKALAMLSGLLQMPPS